MDDIRLKYLKKAKEDRAMVKRESQSDYFGYKTTKKYKVDPVRIAEQRVKDAFTDKQLLDMVDDDVIQNYLRTKKLKRLKKKI